MNSASRRGRCIWSRRRPDAHGDSERSAQKRVLYGVTVGASAYGLLKGQLRWLGAQGWQCSLVTTPDSKARIAAEAEQVELYPVAMTRSVTPLRDLLALVRWLAVLMKVRPDAVNASTPKAGLIGMVAAFLLRIGKRVYVMRGLRLEGAQGPARVLLWLMERITIACATDVIFVSPSLALAAAEIGLGAVGKGWVIGNGSSNGVDVTRLRTAAITDSECVTRESFGFSKSDFVVGFVGRIAPDKGVDTLIRVFQRLAASDGFKLLVVGATEDAELEKRLWSLGGRSHVTGDVTNVPAYMATMDVLCLPTKREGFPNVVLEAGAMQLPVVATRATGSVDAVVNNETGLLVDLGDEEGLMQALQEIASHRDRAQTMGIRGYERAVRDFNPTRIWAGVLAILNGDYGALDLHPVSEICGKNNQKDS